MICPICGCRHGSMTSADNFEDLYDGITEFDYDCEEVCDLCSMTDIDNFRYEDEVGSIGGVITKRFIIIILFILIIITFIDLILNPPNPPLYGFDITDFRPLFITVFGMGIIVFLCYDLKRSKSNGKIK